MRRTPCTHHEHELCPREKDAWCAWLSGLITSLNGFQRRITYKFKALPGSRPRDGQPVVNKNKTKGFDPFFYEINAVSATFEQQDTQVCAVQANYDSGPTAALSIGCEGRAAAAAAAWGQLRAFRSIDDADNSAALSGKIHSRVRGVGKRRQQQEPTTAALAAEITLLLLLAAACSTSSVSSITHKVLTGSATTYRQVDSP